MVRRLIPIIGRFSLAVMAFALVAGALGVVWGASDMFMKIVWSVFVVAGASLLTCLFLDNTN